MAVAPAVRARLWTAQAFGLDLRGDFELLGAVPAPARGGRSTVVELCAEVPAWNPAERLLELRFEDGRLAVTIDAHPEHGFRLQAYDFGRAWVAPGGERVLCAPAGGPRWRWQRYLTGQVLPLAAVLQGLEVFHASAVALDGRAVAVIARSGGGKTSVGLNLALRGLPFLTDDVLALEPDGDALLAHPGLGVANVRPDRGDLVRAIERAELGRAIGRSEQETRLGLRRHGEPLPLGALFFLERPASADELVVERLSPVDPRLLLAGSFNFYLREPSRLVRQLDVCARLARSAAVFRVVCPPSVGPAALAEAIHARATDP